MVENPKDGKVYWSISERDDDDNLVSPVRPWSGKLKLIQGYSGGRLAQDDRRGPFMYADDLYATEAEAKAAYNKAAIETAESLERQAKELRESVFRD